MKKDPITGMPKGSNAVRLDEVVLDSRGTTKAQSSRSTAPAKIGWGSAKKTSRWADCRTGGERSYLESTGVEQRAEIVPNKASLLQSSNTRVSLLMGVGGLRNINSSTTCPTNSVRQTVPAIRIYLACVARTFMTLVLMLVEMHDEAMDILVPVPPSFVPAYFIIDQLISPSPSHFWSPVWERTGNSHAPIARLRHRSHRARM